LADSRLHQTQPTIALFSSLLLVMTGCAQDSSIEPSSERNRQIEVTRDNSDLPAGCSTRETAEVVLDFSEAVSSERIGTIDDLIAAEDDFRSLGVGPPEGRTGEITNDRPSVTSYFESRAQATKRTHSQR
jgi:hypothetical protein